MSPWMRRQRDTWQENQRYRIRFRVRRSDGEGQREFSTSTLVCAGTAPRMEDSARVCRLPLSIRAGECAAAIDRAPASACAYLHTSLQSALGSPGPLEQFAAD